MSATPDTTKKASKSKAKKGGADANGKPGKDKGKKGKGKGKGKDGGGPSLATHPHAAAAVRRAKGLGGCIGFGLAALLSHQAGLSATHVVERALLAGVAGYLLAWACAVTVWRQILLSELRAAAERYATKSPPMLALTGTPPPPPTAAPGADPPAEP